LAASKLWETFTDSIVLSAERRRKTFGRLILWKLCVGSGPGPFRLFESFPFNYYTYIHLFIIKIYKKPFLNTIPNENIILRNIIINIIIIIIYMHTEDNNTVLNLINKQNRQLINWLRCGEAFLIYVRIYSNN